MFAIDLCCLHLAAEQNILWSTLFYSTICDVLFAILFKSKFCICLQAKFGNRQEGTHTALNRFWSTVQKSSCIFFSCTSEMTSSLLFWMIFLNTLVLSHPVRSLLGYTITFSLSFWQQDRLTLLNSLMVMKCILMERIMGINPLGKEDSWVEVSHTWWAV